MEHNRDTAPLSRKRNRDQLESLQQEIEETPSNNGKEEEMPSNNGKEEDESPRRQRRQKVEEPDLEVGLGSINQTLSAEDATQAKKMPSPPLMLRRRTKVSSMTSNEAHLPSLNMIAPEDFVCTSPNALQIRPMFYRFQGHQPPQPPSQLARQSRQGQIAATRSRPVRNGLKLSDIDKDHEGNPLEVVEYVRDIVDHNFRTETDKMPNRHYMSKQNDINSYMRAILIDWLVDVHAKFQVVPEVLWLCVHILDAFLEIDQVVKSELQLVGCAAMMIACKYEQCYLIGGGVSECPDYLQECPHEVQDFVHLCAGAYTAEDVLGMEVKVLTTLDFDITIPTTQFFIARFLKVARSNSYSPLMATLTTYFAERTMQEYHMIKYRPSSVAAGALYLAFRTLNCQPGNTCRHWWTPQIERHTRYSEKSIMPCVLDILRIVKLSVSNQVHLKAVYKKYLSPKFGRVAAMQLPELIGSLSGSNGLK